MWKLTIEQKRKCELSGSEYEISETVAFVSENLTELAQKVEFLMQVEGLHETSYKIESITGKEN